MAGVLVSYFVGGLVFAEFVGYWLHQLLHSEKIPFLSRNHMIHHLKIYGPAMKQRPEEGYRYATTGRVNVGGIGLEWLIPVGLILGLAYAVLGVLHIGLLQSGVFGGAAVLYGYLLFWYMHNAMHQRQFWMTRVPGLSQWFLRARRRHDIHHVRLNEVGQMDRNFGICFFFWDRVFGTLEDHAGRVEPSSLRRAQQRYCDVVAPRR